MDNQFVLFSFAKSYATWSIQMSNIKANITSPPPPPTKKSERPLPIELPDSSLHRDYAEHRQ